MLWQLIDQITEKTKTTKDTDKRPQQLEECTSALGLMWEWTEKDTQANKKTCKNKTTRMISLREH